MSKKASTTSSSVKTVVSNVKKEAGAKTVSSNALSQGDNKASSGRSASNGTFVKNGHDPTDADYVAKGNEYLLRAWQSISRSKGRKD